MKFFWKNTANQRNLLNTRVKYRQGAIMKVKKNIMSEEIINIVESMTRLSKVNKPVNHPVTL